MTDPKLATEFEDKATPTRLIDAREYHALLEKLLADGKGYGKTEPVAAFLLRNLSIVDTKKDNYKPEEIKIANYYLIMDPKDWPLEYARELLMKEISLKWAQSIVTEQDLNTPTYRGPGIWTNKQSSFETDYVRREEEVEVIDGRTKQSTMYDPNPEAFRVCLQIDEPIIIPTTWGTYPISTGGTLAVREKDVKDLAEALQNIRDGVASVKEALYKTQDDGSLVARFDIYGMEPDFLEKNYQPVTLKDSTTKIKSAFSAPAP